MQEQDTYYLTLYVNSNVMGSQFTLEGYPAMVSVDWDTLSEDPTAPAPESAETAQTQPTQSSAGQVETMEGLNIYRAEDEAEADPALPQSVEGNIIAYFKVPLLIWTGIFGVLIIAAGVGLIIWGNKENEP